MLKTNIFNRKNILIGITGGIAAYKSCELIRYFKKNGADVRVVLTAAGEKFITRLTLETLSQNPVALEMFPEDRFSATHHINWADWADLAMIAPASYNFIGKLANGIADDLLSTMCAALTCPVVVAPAMNVNMWQNPALRENLTKLEDRGILICPPEEGFLAEGYSGMGRLAPLHHQAQYAYRAIRGEQTSLADINIVITAGRTLERIDPVRYLSNHSTGKMGYALAWEAFARGAKVTLIHGPGNLAAPDGIHLVPVESAAAMEAACRQYFSEADIYISAAAIADYRPKSALSSKIKKTDGGMNLELERTTDVLGELAKLKKSNQLMIGFAVETDNEEANALAKMEKKNLDMIVLNNPQRTAAGFAHDENTVAILKRSGEKQLAGPAPKLEIAAQIFAEIQKMRLTNV